MPTNPTITAYGTSVLPYVVGQSDTAYYDIDVANLTDGAEVMITAPAGAEVHAWTLAPAEPTVRWSPAGIEAALLTGGAWQPVAAIGSWQAAVAAGPAATDPALVTITSGVPTGGALRIRVRGIRTSGPAATATLEAQANADTRRIVADPTIFGMPGPSLTPVAERTLVTLAGTPAVSVQEAMAVPAVFGPLPATRGVWNRTSSVLGFTLTPMGAANAQFTAPGVYAATAETFDFRAYYDFDGDTLFSAGEPDNVEPVSVTIEPLHHRMALVLDRSGSMAGSLPGGAGTKWAATVRAAHIWLDLFAALRAPNDQTAGFVTFEDDTCGYPTCATAADVTFRNPANGVPAAGLSTLTTFTGLNSIDIGGPESCTPIGDAMVRAFQGLVTPALGSLDTCSILLLTDGRENSGCTTVKATKPSGVSKTVASELAALPVLQSKLAIYVLGAGSSVDEDALNNLPALGGLGAKEGGYYRLATTLDSVLESFGQMITHSVDSEDLGAVIDNVGPDGPAAFFMTSEGEHRLVVTVPWTNPADTLRLSHRDQGSADPWTTVPGPDVTLRQRATHGMLIVELATALAGLGTTARDWKVERLSAGVPGAISEVLAIVDLHLKATVSFDKQVYATGEPMIVSCSIVAGKDPVLGAQVVAGPDAPTQGLGTFLSTNGAQAVGVLPVSQLSKSELASVIRKPPGSQYGDPGVPKAALYDHFLQQNGLDDLPRGPGIFADGTDELFDDGTHDDGSADDGVYANRFEGTDKEGTYTFRFRASGTLPDGSSFSRVITVSKWVGVSVDPASSPVTVTAVASPPPGLLGQVIAVTPRDARGEYLGPFRESEVAIQSTVGTFSGPVESRLDGSYARTLHYMRGEDPRVTVVAGGQPLCPAGTGGDREGGWWKRFLRWLRRLWRWLFRREKRAGK